MEAGAYGSGRFGSSECDGQPAKDAALSRIAAQNLFGALEPSGPGAWVKSLCHAKY
jgi:hypothetical protein